MLMIRCTKKLRKEMGLKQPDLAPEESGDRPFLGSWYANLIYIDRRKCVLFVNEKTLFNFIVPDVLKAHLKDLSVLFKIFLQCVLADEGFETHIREKILAEYTEVGYANTENRSVLSSMNELAFHYKDYILADGGVRNCTVPGIIRDLNRMPMSAIGRKHPVEALKTLCKTIM